MSFHKRMSLIVAAALLLLSLCGCGGDGSSSDPDRPKETDADVSGRTSTGDGTETEDAVPAPETVDSIYDSAARLLSFYHTKDSTYIMAAFQCPQGNPHNIAAGFYIGEEGIGINFAKHGAWSVVFAEAEGSDRSAEDFRLEVMDRSDKRSFTFSADDPASVDEYAGFGLYRMGSRYVTFGHSVKYGYLNQKTNKYFRVEITVCDVAMLDQNSRLDEADVRTEAFTLYAGDGTPAEDFFGTSCVPSVTIYPSNDFKTTASVKLDFFPTQTGGTEAEQTAVVQEMLNSLMDTAPYLIYTDPLGNEFTFPLSYDDVPPAYRS